MDISDQAVKYLGERGKPDERVFVTLKYSAWHNQALEKWCMKAGILKDITFHCGRHSNNHFPLITSTLQNQLYQ